MNGASDGAERSTRLWRPVHLEAVVVSSLTAVFLMACGGGTGPGYGGDDDSSGGSGSIAGTEIQMVSDGYGNFSFTPETDTISVGDTITWTNQTSTAHTVQANDGSWDSNGDVSANGSYQRVFSSAGEHGYYCTYHGSPGSGMHGTIVVEQ